MSTEEIIANIKKLPDFQEMYVGKDGPSGYGEIDCGHEHVDFDTNDLKALASAVGSSGNYTANDDTFPTEITFQNGRSIGIAFDGDRPFLTMGTDVAAMDRVERYIRGAEWTTEELRDELTKAGIDPDELIEKVRSRIAKHLEDK